MLVMSIKTPCLIHCANRHFFLTYPTIAPPHEQEDCFTSVCVGYMDHICCTKACPNKYVLHC